MRVDDAEHADAASDHPQDPTRQRRGVAVELDVRGARFTVSAGRQGRHGDGVILLAPTEQHPAELLVAALGRPVPIEVVEERLADAFLEDDPREPAIRAWPGRRRCFDLRTFAARLPTPPAVDCGQPVAEW